MGNDQSTVMEEERRMLESLYQIQVNEGRLDDSTASASATASSINSKLNRGTSAPNCQPSHTLRELEEAQRQRQQEEHLAELLDINDSRHAKYVAANASPDGPATTNTTNPNTTTATASLSSYVQMAKTGYQELVNAIIRPPRAQYREEHLGPPAFSFLGRRFTRTDFTLRTHRHTNLQCSHWEPVERPVNRIPVVIYMHGNASARVEALPQLTCLLSLGVAVFAFDFGGSGKSDGEYVSLGWNEREDLMCVVAHLRATDVVSTIALWGRSMGAGEERSDWPSEARLIMTSQSAAEASYGYLITISHLTLLFSYSHGTLTRRSRSIHRRNDIGLALCRFNTTLRGNGGKGERSRHK
jgi:hypothetical protein